MAKHPAYLWYPSDFGQGTKYFNFMQKSVYRALLDAQWDDGYIPNDETLLANMIGISVDEFAKNWAVVRKKFKEIEPDKLINERLERERIKLEKRSQNGKDAAHKRWHRDGNKEVMPTHSQGNTYNDNENENEIELDNGLSFGKFENLFFGDVPEDIRDLANRLTPTEKADQWHDYVEVELRKLGYKTKREVPTRISPKRMGRIDLVAEKETVVVGIELDYRTPRKNSVYKVQQYPNGAILLRDPKIIQKPNSLDNMRQSWEEQFPEYVWMDGDHDNVRKIIKFLRHKARDHPEEDTERLIVDTWGQMVKQFSGFWAGKDLKTVSSHMNSIWNEITSKNGNQAKDQGKSAYEILKERRKRRGSGNS